MSKALHSRTRLRRRRRFPIARLHAPGVELEASSTAKGRTFIEEVRGDDPELASYLRIDERELEAGGLT